MNGVPFYGNPMAHTTEFQASGRQTRVSLLAEGKVGGATITGYEEADFLTSSVNSNNRERNRYGLRQRQLWAQAALDNGLTFTAGRRWPRLSDRHERRQNQPGR